MKLQESYFSESNAIGGWSLIGYKAPGAKSINDTIQGTTTNFQYDQKGTYTNGTIAVDNSGNIAETEVWAAKNYAAKLNDCVKDSEWLVKATVSNSVVTFAAEVPTAAGCKELTPSFTGIGK